MKMKALLALGLCFALTVPCLAQDDKKEVDSVYITPFAGAKIILVGKGMEKLLKENNLEVLKNKFVEDYQASAKDKDFPATAKNIIYLAGADGRRRLKAIPDEVAPVNVKDEIKAFSSNLPPFHYTIYDLMKDYQYHIYVKEPEMLDSLEKVDCSMLTTSASSNKLLLNQTNSGKIALLASKGLVIDPLTKKSKGFGVLAPTVGLGLINSILSPSIGFDMYYYRLNRYGKPNYEAGISYSFYMLADFQNKTFTNFYPISSSNLYYMKRFGNNGFGISLGKWVAGNDKLFGSRRDGPLDKAWQFGIINQIGDFRLEYNFIFDKQNKTNTSLTLRYTF